MTKPSAHSLFHESISGRRRDARARALRLLLGSLEPVYTLGILARNFAFDSRLRTIHRVRVPVISVGNITAGGTGKTPFVAWIVRWLQNHAQRVAIVSRGYRADAGGTNDEARELELQLPDVPHLQNPNRFAAAQQAVDGYQSQVIVLDDGFQHRRLHRNLDIVLIDAMNPFGFDHLLPRGLLREPLSALHRAHVVGLSRADLVDQRELEKICTQLQRHAPQAIHVQVQFVPRTLRSTENELLAVDHLRGQKVLAFCGIGNPQAFARTLASCDLVVVGQRSFPDHHPYNAADLAELAMWANEHPHAQALLCTEKDLVKLGVQRIGRLPLWSLRVAAEVSRGLEALERQLMSLLEAATE